MVTVTAPVMYHCDQVSPPAATLHLVCARVSVHVQAQE